MSAFETHFGVIERPAFEIDHNKDFLSPKPIKNTRFLRFVFSTLETSESEGSRLLGVLAGRYGRVLFHNDLRQHPERLSRIWDEYGLDLYDFHTEAIERFFVPLEYVIFRPQQIVIETSTGIKKFQIHSKPILK